MGKNIMTHRMGKTDYQGIKEECYTLMDALPQFVWLMQPDGSLIYTNQRWRDYNHPLSRHAGEQKGFTRQQRDDCQPIQDRQRMLPHADSLSEKEIWLQNLHPEDKERVLELQRQAFIRGEPYKFEYRLRDGHTGTYHWFFSQHVPLRNKAGQIVQWLGNCTDIDDQKRTEEALRESQERASALMNSNIIGINIIEGEQIVDANDTFLCMTGYTREDLRAENMNWLHMTHPDYLARTQQAHQELAIQQAITYEKEYVCKDGSRLPVLVGGVLFQHHPCQAIGFVLDNSARKELEQRKDDFISMANHELRTPLTALKLQTTLLHRQLARQDTLDQVPALSSMETQLNKVTRLVEELLDASKIQAGRLEYVWEPVDLDALLREIADTLQHTHPSHRILVHGTVETSLIGDRDRLGQVFTNLLSNAIKYAPDAQTVEMELSASDEAVAIRVQDHGLGIGCEQRNKIFERFYRVTGLSRRAIPGLGMGLYIVAEIVEAHGGTITVDSAVGKGSTFTVTLPTRTSLSSPWIDREKQRGEQ